MNKETPCFLEAVKPIRQNVSFEQLMEEADCKSTSYETFRAIADKIEWKESLDELLEALKQ